MSDSPDIKDKVAAAAVKRRILAHVMWGDDICNLGLAANWEEHEARNSMPLVYPSVIHSYQKAESASKLILEH